jgi:hypothetical protein
MNEAGWLACADPTPMLEHLKGIASDRKLRLYLAACCRRIWSSITDERSRKAIEVAEQFADDRATVEERIAAETPAKAAHRDSSRVRRAFAGFPAFAAWTTVVADPFPEASEAVDAIAVIVADASWEAIRARTPVSNLVFNNSVSQILARTRDTEFSSQAALLRDIFGNPFRPVVFDPVWRTSTVAALAQAAYQERSYPEGTFDLDRLSILADALEDAGCTDPTVLSHLREPGLHVRGCFVIDALLGKSG